jgi:hypothetical protein
VARELFTWPAGIFRSFAFRRTTAMPVVGDPRNEVMLRVELYERDIAPKLQPDELGLLFDDNVKTLGHQIRNIEYTLNQERPLLTEAGMRERSAELTGKVATTIEQIEARAVKVDEKLTELRQRALTGMEPHPEISGGWIHKKPLEMTPERIANHREQRDILRSQLASDAISQPQLDLLYLRAKADGSDPDLVAAIEGAPKAFPLISEEVRRRAEDAVINASPFKVEVDRLRFAREQHRLITTSAKERLRDLGWQPESSEDAMRRRLEEDARRRGRF